MLLEVPIHRARAALAASPGILVATDLPALGADPLPFEGALEVDLGATSGVRQDVTGELGPMTWDARHLTVAVHWEPTAHPHLLPTFVGFFEVMAEPPGSRLTLRGAYTVPLGPAGRVGDRVAGGRVAQRVLDHRLEDVARRLVDAARAIEPEPPEAGIDPGTGSENYLG